jgi:hypothetical protein
VESKNVDLRQVENRMVVTGTEVVKRGQEKCRSKDTKFQLDRRYNFKRPIMIIVNNTLY